MIDPDKLSKLFDSINFIRDLLPELAVILPDTAVIDEVAVESIPYVEKALGLIFEAAAIAQSHPEPGDAREALTQRLQEKAQAALNAKFGGGHG